MTPFFSLALPRLVSKCLAGATVLVLVACSDAEPDAETFVDRLPEDAREERTFMLQPNSFFEDQLDEPQVVLDGQALHPKLQYEFQERAKRRAASGVDYNKWLFDIWSKPEGRARLRAAVDVNWVKMAHDVDANIDTKDYEVPSGNRTIRLRSYRERSQEATSGVKPGLLYFHGGGYLMASIEAVEPQARILASEGDLVVVSVNYSLAPEHPFPAAHEDAFAAYNWLLENAATLGIDPARIGVAGDSAGGNLAAVISDEMARLGNPAPKAQLLYYPFTDADSAKYKSYDIFGDGFGLDKNFIKRATDAFITNPKELKHRWLTLVDNVDFTKQPPTIVATAGFDPIRDQGRQFADNIRDAGGQVIYKHYPSLNHGFLEASATIDDAQKACFETAQMIGDLLRQ